MNQALKQTSSLRDRIVGVLREHHEVKHIGELADRLEAALSAAEPAGWQWRHPRATGGEWMHCPNGPRADKLSETEYRAVYAAPCAPSVAVTDEQIIDLLAIHSNHKEKAVARDGSGVIEYEVISHARAIKFARAIVEAACPAQMKADAPKGQPVEAFAEMLDALENARELLEYGGFELEKIDRAISNGRTIAAVTIPARQLTDLGPLEIRLQKLITENPEKARLASSREDLRMWFIAELISDASGRIPLLEIEGLVSRQLAVAKGGEA